MTTRISIADIDAAAHWLECNEGGQGEAESCARVAAYLRAEADRRDMRTQCRKAGLPVAKVRAMLKERLARESS